MIRSTGIRQDSTHVNDHRMRYVTDSPLPIGKIAGISRSTDKQTASPRLKQEPSWVQVARSQHRKGSQRTRPRSSRLICGVILLCLQRPIRLPYAGLGPVRWDLKDTWHCSITRPRIPVRCHSPYPPAVVVIRPLSGLTGCRHTPFAWPRAGKPRRFLFCSRQRRGVAAPDPAAITGATRASRRP